jgi:uncharacterized protein YprB with RNaseH-like and TPR domain
LAKPKGEELIAWAAKWDAATHEEKLKLAAEYGVTYETMRHWRSDSGIPVQKQEPVMRMSIEELLGCRPAVNLDFVFFDIETSNLTADFSILMTAAIKPYGLPPIVFRADDYPTWDGNRKNDYQITKDVADELRRHAVVVTHYGQYFDIPYIRAKMQKHGLEPLPPMFGIDTWQIAKKNFKVSTRRLKGLGEFFDIGEKDPVEGNLWMEAAYNGSREAMDRIVAHNIRDVELLERLACISFPYLKSIPRL